MKFVIVIPDGCADDPVPWLNHRTPMQAAHMPHADRLARRGVVGRTNNVPRPLTPASDVATLSLFGYDPLRVYTGRAPLEAAALGVSLGPHDWAIRCNTVHVDRGEMRDFTAGHISTAEGHRLIDALRSRLAEFPCPGRFELAAGVGYRHLLIYRGNADPVFGDDLRTQPPHDIPDRPIADHLPSGTGSDILIRFMEWSRGVFADQPVNADRRRCGRRDATQVWLWGQGRAPSLSPFRTVYGKTGAITTGVDLVRGVGALLGWDRLEAKGVTDYLDNDYGAQARLAIEALPHYDIVCVHVEAPDEASHEGDAAAKVEALERIDRDIIGPLCDELPRHGEWRMLVAPDHRTPVQTRAHSYGAVPFVAAGSGIAADAAATYDETTAAAGPLVFDPGWPLMTWFLNPRRAT